jgi:cytochrome c-type biogenesis protein CcmH/NrfG
MTPSCICSARWQVEPNNGEFWRILGRFCVDNYLAVRETALPAARQALTLAPANPDMLDLMGLVLLQLEDETGAERFLQRALEINPVPMLALTCTWASFI